MARTVRDTNLETRTARLRLAARGKPYWRLIESGLHLGYRRIRSGGGSWVARRFIGNSRYSELKIGLADDLQDADGSLVLSFKHAQEAARIWWKAEAARLSGVPIHTGPYTLRHALDDYFRARERRASKGMASDRSSAEARIVPALGMQDIQKLTTHQIRNWHEDLASSPKLIRGKAGQTDRSTQAVDFTDPEAQRARRSTANRVLTILKAALNHAYHEGRIGTDEAWRKVKPFREVDTPIVRFLDPQECFRLVNACQEPFRDLVCGALLTGCRYGELISMRVTEFNAQSGTISVRVSKSGKPRHVALNDEGQKLFQGLTAGRKASDLIFRRGDREWRASEQKRPLEQACKAAKIDPPATFHILRHTYASQLAMSGVPMGVIAAQLGHSDTRMTERHYAHLAPDYVSATVRAALPTMGIVAKSNVQPLARASG